MSSEHKVDQTSVMEFNWQANTSFRRLLNSCKEPRVAPVQLSDSYRCLKVWSENIAAHCHVKISLDHQLREVSSERDGVKTLLTALKMFLAEGK